MDILGIRDFTYEATPGCLLCDGPDELDILGILITESCIELGLPKWDQIEMHILVGRGCTCEATPLRLLHYGLD